MNNPEQRATPAVCLNVTDRSKIENALKNADTAFAYDENLFGQRWKHTHTSVKEAYEIVRNAKTPATFPLAEVAKAIKALQMAQGSLIAGTITRYHVDEALELLGEAERNHRDARAADYVTNKGATPLAKPTNLPDLGRAFEVLDRLESGELNDEPFNEVARASVRALTQIVRQLASEKWEVSRG